jgi:hypothetical protein
LCRLLSPRLLLLHCSLLFLILNRILNLNIIINNFLFFLWVIFICSIVFNLFCQLLEQSGLAFWWHWSSSFWLF